MRKLRPTLVETKQPGLGYQATFFRVLDAVLHRRGLIHGQLENGRGRYCAIGAYFKESNIPINSNALDEIAAYNDSFPYLSQRQRWQKVQAWLKFQVKLLKGRKP
jgi:hypothetical protein